MKDYDKILEMEQSDVNVYVCNGKVAVVFDCRFEPVYLDMSREEALQLAALLTKAAEALKDGG